MKLGKAKVVKVEKRKGNRWVMTVDIDLTFDMRWNLAPNQLHKAFAESKQKKGASGKDDAAVL
jgi:hypothetical protein